jgi:aspartate racemase
MIGILAGMGPKSTAPFIEKVVETCQQSYGAQCDMDFPPMMIYSCPTPFYLDRPVDHSAMKEAIVAGTKKLAVTGVDYIAIPCNIAHIYFEAVREAVSVPVLNMVEETIKCIPADHKRVAVLATPSTIEAQIYQAGLVRSGKEFVLEPHWQEAVSRVLAIIKGGGNIQEGIAVWQDLLENLQGKVSSAIIACTDLNVVADQVSSRILIVDSSACLANVVVDRYYKRAT